MWEAIKQPQMKGCDYMYIRREKQDLAVEYHVFYDRTETGRDEIFPIVKFDTLEKAVAFIQYMKGMPIDEHIKNVMLQDVHKVDKPKKKDDSAA